jgi:hypothetical protein
MRVKLRRNVPAVNRFFSGNSREAHVRGHHWLSRHHERRIALIGEASSFARGISHTIPKSISQAFSKSSYGTFQSLCQREVASCMHPRSIGERSSKSLIHFLILFHRPRSCWTDRSPSSPVSPTSRGASGSALKPARRCASREWGKPDRNVAVGESPRGGIPLDNRIWREAFSACLIPDLPGIRCAPAATRDPRGGLLRLPEPAPVAGSEVRSPPFHDYQRTNIHQIP